MSGQYGYYSGNKTIKEIAEEIALKFNLSRDVPDYACSRIKYYIEDNYKKGTLLAPEVIGYLKYKMNYPISIVSSLNPSCVSIIKSLKDLAFHLSKN